ncbi:MAG: FtsX-like permease family protein [Planctomycetaceae bacterium]
MTLLGIAWRSIRQRPLQSALTALSLALGVALVVTTLVVSGVVQRAFASGPGLGYNMIVGAKGSPLQLVLNSVYLISKPVENIPWSVYEAFLPAADRRDGEDGRFAPSVRTAIPICMGDYYRGYRVVGTNRAYFERLTAGDGRPFAFAKGENFRDDDLYTAVVGADVAAKLGLAVGDGIAPQHGADPTKIHDPFRLTGILARTGTPVDRGVYVNMEGFYLQEGHAKPPGEDAPADDAAPAPGLLPYAEREVTALLVETAAPPGLPPELMAMELARSLNEGRDAQAAMPVREMRQLLDAFVRPLELLLLLVTILVVVVSAIGILVSMVGSALERSRDVAIMRALGAGRGTVLATVLIEAVLLAGLGGLAGWVLGHGVVAAIAPWVADRAGVVVGFLSGSPAELLLVPLLVGLAVLAALIPALSAYRTDVARWL